jgi:antitoxin (DNA-binding transcriptional repressor) of toxin-antitoxin stability system
VPDISQRRTAGIDKVATGSYLGCMRAVGVKVLKNKLSEYIRLAAGGERILVTDRDRVVAELVPPEPGRAELLGDARLAEAVREGWISPPVLRVAEPPARYPVADLASVMGELERDRGER